MNKNAIWAVVLSALVMGAYMFVQVKFFTPKPQENTAVELTEEQKAEETVVNAQLPEDSAVFDVDSNNNSVITESEESYTIKTNKLEIVFTNRGGDVTSIKVLDHNDTKTKQPVELVENVSAGNRAFALSWGGSDKNIINDIFKMKVYPVENGEYKISFARIYKTYNLVKTYTFKDNEYLGKLDIYVEPKEGFEGISLDADGKKVSYTLRTSPQIGPYYNKKLDRYENRTFIAHKDTKSSKTILNDGKNGEYKKGYNWAGITGKYFCEFIVPVKPENIVTTKYYSDKTGFELSDAQAFFTRSAVGSERTVDSYYIYAGPRNEKEFQKYSKKDDNSWNIDGLRFIDAISTYQFLGWLESILKWMMEMIYKLVPNWGVSIIIMTIIFKMLLFPLTIKQTTGMQKMQVLQPKMQAIQTKYKDNPAKMQEETSKLYKEAGYNPMSGCLPMILQMMALFAMFDLFNNYFEFRGASFIPGWIDDLSMGDSVLSWKYDIPFIGYHLRILPIIYLFSQLLYGKFTNMGGATAGQSASTMKFMTYGLPIIFSFMFYSAPSGLLLFWTVSNVLQFGQTMIINKFFKNTKVENKETIKFPNKKGRR